MHVWGMHAANHAALSGTRCTTVDFALRIKNVCLKQRPQKVEQCYNKNALGKQQEPRFHALRYSH